MKVSLATRYADYDTKGHVNNAVYLTYFEMARHHVWVNHMGGGEDFPFIVGEARVRYRSPAMLGDPLEAEIFVSEIRNRAWVFGYRITDSRDGRLVAEGDSVQVMYDYAARAPMPIPGEFRAQLEELRAPATDSG